MLFSLNSLLAKGLRKRNVSSRRLTTFYTLCIRFAKEECIISKALLSLNIFCILKYLRAKRSTFLLLLLNSRQCKFIFYGKFYIIYLFRTFPYHEYIFSYKHINLLRQIEIIEIAAVYQLWLYWYLTAEMMVISVQSDQGKYKLLTTTLTVFHH